MALALLAQLVSLGCATLPRSSSGSPERAKASTATVSLHGKPLEVHVIAPLDPVAADILVLYASGAGSTRTVVTGWSRGAAFAVLVGADGSLQPELAGVIAIGLPDEEQLRVRSDSDDKQLGGQANGTTHRMRFETYGLIPTIDRTPCAVIQSTRDDYLPAEQARRLFGPDTEVRRLYAVDARNHRFSGGHERFMAVLGDALKWVVAHSSSTVTRDSRK